MNANNCINTDWQFWSCCKVELTRLGGLGFFSAETIK